jgi:hypothetical protein
MAPDRINKYQINKVNHIKISENIKIFQPKSSKIKYHQPKSSKIKYHQPFTSHVHHFSSTLSHKNRSLRPDGWALTGSVFTGSTFTACALEDLRSVWFREIYGKSI